MSQSVNIVTLLGNVGKPVEMRFTPSGTQVSTFSVATNRKYKGGDGEYKEETTWHNIVVWGKSAELCNQYLDKGSSVFISGRINNRSWDGQDGQKHYKTEIIADRVIFLDKKTQGNNAPVPEQEEQTGDIEPKDIPF
jgi:single-strand DNA-binding protein